MMIGPAPGRALCPWCQGTGIDHERDGSIWTGTASLGHRVRTVQVVACDGCGGTGRVTKASARAMTKEDDPCTSALPARARA